MSDLLDKMRQNPRGDWTIRDIEKICNEHQLICSAPKRGSHYKVARPGFATILTIPSKRPIKPIYIRLLIQLIDGRDRGA